MSLYWLHPSWTKAVCSCGTKIWPEGDPDWGMCYDCFCQQHQQSQSEQPYPYSPPCDICGKNEAVAAECGFGVCSEECANEAKLRDELRKKEGK